MSLNRKWGEHGYCSGNGRYGFTYMAGEERIRYPRRVRRGSRKEETCMIKEQVSERDDVLRALHAD